ncbi:hypothetical protein B2J93_4423 [Marssonina coronariae]|uniref:Uncharacterized protein n=1 Tax=Diplocarpon coronariae TaxID=2795749 RepID=A0A218Z8U6_9HELO|nr:hypothetical protein B2J93_4423 [Marssonina coronariae]
MNGARTKKHAEPTEPSFLTTILFLLSLALFLVWELLISNAHLYAATRNTTISFLLSLTTRTAAATNFTISFAVVILIASFSFTLFLLRRDSAASTRRRSAPKKAA